MKKNYFKSLMQVALLLAAPFVVSSCDDVIGQEDNPVASYVQWKTDADVDEVEMKVGGTYTRVATAVSSAIIAYESDNTEVATVDPVSGEVTAKKIGEANISAVVTGMSTNGRKVFEETKLTYKVNVIDKKIYVKALVEKTDSIEDVTANKGMVIDFSKKFKFFPATGLSVTYRVIPMSDITALAAADKPKDHPHYNPSIASINPTTGALTIQNATGWCWVEAKINNSGATVPAGYDDNTALLKKDTIKVRVKEAIAYYNEANERTILTADKYKKISDYTAAATYDGTYAAGIYFVDAGFSASTVKIAGNVTFIYENGIYTTIQNLIDKTDEATLNLFVQTGNASWDATDEVYTFAKGTANLEVNKAGAATGGSAITNFKAINNYGVTIDAMGNGEGQGGFAAVKELNVYAGKVIAHGTGTTSFGISAEKVKVAGGTVKAYGNGTDPDKGYGIIADVEVTKGELFAVNAADYRAIKGSLNAGSGIKFKFTTTAADDTDTDGWPKWTGVTPTWEVITTPGTSNARYIMAKKWE